MGPRTPRARSEPGSPICGGAVAWPFEDLPLASTLTGLLAKSKCAEERADGSEDQLACPAVRRIELEAPMPEQGEPHAGQRNRRLAHPEPQGARDLCHKRKGCVHQQVCI